MSAGVTSLEPVRGRGYTAARRYRATLDDGRAVFAKLAVDELTAGWLREEYLVYSHVSGPFIPPLLGWDDDGAAPLLVLPDLGDSLDAPPWDDARIAAVLASLDEISAAPAPPRLESAERFHLGDRWESVAQDPEPFLSLGLCSREWLDANFGALDEAARAAPFDGDRLVHLDVRSDNIAFVEGRAVLVDWNWASVGNPELDLAAWAPSVAAEGGPAPEELAPGADAGFAAALAGLWGAAAGRPPPPTADPTLRGAQLAQLRVALPWACRALGLPPPDGG
jgi:hypothetical protein